MVFRHENFQLWESPCTGCLLTTHDYVTLNKDGMHITCLASHESKIIEGQYKKLMCHSLESFNYLKIDNSNFMEYEFNMQDDTKLLTISQ